MSVTATKEPTLSTMSTGRLAEAFVQVADSVVEGSDLVGFLTSLTGHVAEVSGTVAVGLVLADHRGDLQFMAASQESARSLELFVLQNDQGPCRDCFSTGEAVLVSDLRDAHDRWPVFTPRALSAGFRSVFALPMRHHQDVIGSLSLSDTRTDPFSPEDLRVVQAMANIATIGILHERAIRALESLTEQLQGALSSRVVIEQAKGVLAQLHHVDIDTAFGLLRGYSRSHRLRLGEVAEAVVRDARSHPGIAAGLPTDRRTPPS